MKKLLFIIVVLFGVLATCGQRSKNNDYQNISISINEDCCNSHKSSSCCTNVFLAIGVIEKQTLKLGVITNANKYMIDQSTYFIYKKLLI